MSPTSRRIRQDLEAQAAAREAVGLSKVLRSLQDAGWRALNTPWIRSAIRVATSSATTAAATQSIHPSPSNALAAGAVVGFLHGAIETVHRAINKDARPEDSNAERSKEDRLRVMGVTALTGAALGGILGVSVGGLSNHHEAEARTIQAFAQELAAYPDAIVMIQPEQQGGTTLVISRNGEPQADKSFSLSDRSAEQALEGIQHPTHGAARGTARERYPILAAIMPQTTPPATTRTP